MNIEKLAELFKKFPGIGPRQARRFAYFVISKNNDYIESLMSAINVARKSVKRCDQCFRLFEIKKSEKTCDICSDSKRDRSILMIVAKDIDLENVEKSRAFNGQYFVLGGPLPILEKEPEKFMRINEMLTRVEQLLNEGILNEIILALNANTEGENTALYLENKLSIFKDIHKLKISRLGRGLSTGTELEYSDSDTLNYALRNRF